MRTPNNISTSVNTEREIDVKDIVAPLENGTSDTDETDEEGRSILFLKQNA